MADQTIFDLGQETAMTAEHRLVVQDTGASTTAQSATFALVGGLEPDAQTPSGNITGAVGKLYVITTTSMVADIDFSIAEIL